MNLKSPLLIGFGISNKNTYKDAINFSNGAIIGSAFINFIDKEGIEKIDRFIKKIRA